MLTRSSCALTARQRLLAALDFQAVDRLPFWPKLDAAYPRGQGAPFADMPIAQLHQWIGSDRHEWCGPGLRDVRQRTELVEERDGPHLKRTWRTPLGDMHSHDIWDGPSQSWHPLEFPVKSREDIARMRFWFEDVRPEPDPDALSAIARRITSLGQEGVIAACVGKSPLMHWIELITGVENAHFFLADHPDEVAALFEVMQQDILRRMTLAIEHCPTDMLYLIENTSTTLLSVTQYQQLNWEHIRQAGELGKQAGRRIMLHMCGHLLKLLPDLSRLPVTGFEAFTAPPLGSATLAQGRSHCPDKVLIGGTHATLWLRPAGQIIAFLEQRLAELPHHRGLIISSSGVMPPGCPPQTIREVCQWVQQQTPR